MVSGLLKARVSQTRTVRRMASAGKLRLHQHYLILRTKNFAPAPIFPLLAVLRHASLRLPSADRQSSVLPHVFFHFACRASISP